MKYSILSLALFATLSLSASSEELKTEIICGAGEWNATTIRNFSLGASNDRAIPDGQLRAFIVEGYTTYLLDQCKEGDFNVTCTSSLDARFVSTFIINGESIDATVSSPDYGQISYTNCKVY